MLNSPALCLLLVILPAAVSLHALLDCTKSKFGCCVDGDPTGPDADGWNQKGCGVKLCKDLPPRPGYCKKALNDNLCKIGFFKTRNKMLQFCAFTCQLCKQPAPTTCMGSPFGCCWDGKTAAQGPAGKGCPRCRDRYRILCKRIAGDCKNNEYPIMRKFLRQNCQATCGIC